MTMNSNQKLRDLLREIVAYAREAGHTWCSLNEAETLLAAPIDLPRQEKPEDWNDVATLAAAFTEWDRRYREEPERFQSEAVRLLKETPQTYGAACAPYLLSILEDQRSQRVTGERVVKVLRDFSSTSCPESCGDCKHEPECSIAHEGEE